MSGGAVADRGRLRVQVSETIRDLVAEVSSLSHDLLGDDTALVGREAAIRSLELVELLVLVEDYAQDELGVAFSWTDHSAMSPENSTFRTIGSLTDHLVEVVSAG